jgi:predicted 3-demethylubiquinone-9 3-methyltransferase (glyoxalase superfamily)
MPNQKITTHLWFDKEAREAAEFYVSTFGGDSKIKNTTVLENTPSGNVDIVDIDILGNSFTLLSAGPLFKFNPSISFILNFDPSRDSNARKHLGALWDKLSEGGTVLMPLDKYPFSERYGWIQDKYGLSWQLILSDPKGEPRPFITPSIMFVGDLCGKAEEAIDFYVSVFKDAPSAPGETKRGQTARYPEGMTPDKEGTILFADFMLLGQWFAAMDSAQMHDFIFNEAISFMVHCDTQDEIDYYWEKLSAVPESEQCGWLKDRYGVSWQIVPSAMDEMMGTKDKEKLARVTEAFLKMKKFDIIELQRAYEG